MVHILNEGFDHIYVDKDALKKSKKKSVTECGDRPEEYKDFDDSMNPNSFGVELDEGVNESLNEAYNFKLDDSVKEYIKYYFPDDYQLDKIPTRLTFADVLANMQSRRGNLVGPGLDSVLVNRILFGLADIIGDDEFNKAFTNWEQQSVRKNRKIKDSLNEENENSNTMMAALFTGGKINQVADINDYDSLADKFFDESNYYYGAYTAIGVLTFNSTIPTVGGNRVFPSTLVDKLKEIEIMGFNPRYYYADDDTSINSLYNNFISQLNYRYDVPVTYTGESEYIFGSYGDLYWGPEEESDVNESLNEAKTMFRPKEMRDWLHNNAQFAKEIEAYYGKPVDDLFKDDIWNWLSDNKKPYRKFIKDFGLDESLNEARSLAKPIKKDMKNAYKSFDRQRDYVRKKNAAMDAEIDNNRNKLDMDISDDAVQGIKDFMHEREPKWDTYKSNYNDELEQGEYPFYVTYYQETPYYHPEEGGYYVAGLYAVSSMGFDNKADAIQYAEEMAHDFRFQKQNNRHWDLGSRYIGNNEHIWIETAKDYLSHEKGDSMYESLNEGIKRIISRLNESPMSDEDKADSKLLRGISDKLRRNVRARLTADEKAVIKKYGLVINKNRFRDVGDLDVPISFRGQEMTNHLVDRDELWKNYDKINYADKARKMKERGLGYEANLLPDLYGKDSWNHRIGKDKGLLDQERRFENSVMTSKVGLMNRLLSDRDNYSTAIDAYDDDRDEIEREYQQRLADLEDDRQYNKGKLDAANKDIDKLLRRDKKEESLRGKRNMRSHKTTAIAEDFDERNLNKMGTSEYEANANRKKHIDMYRKFANLTEEEEITESNIDELALKKTACYSNREPERIKAEILGKRYSDYEL